MGRGRTKIMELHIAVEDMIHVTELRDNLIYNALADKVPAPFDSISYCT